MYEFQGMSAWFCEWANGLYTENIEKQILTLHQDEQKKNVVLAQVSWFYKFTVRQKGSISSRQATGRTRYKALNADNLRYSSLLAVEKLQVNYKQCSIDTRNPWCVLESSCRHCSLNDKVLDRLKCGWDTLVRSDCVPSFSVYHGMTNIALTLLTEARVVGWIKHPVFFFLN